MSRSTIFSHSVYEKIRSAWERDQSHPHRGREQKPLPELGIIAAFLDTAFLASIQREEGAPTQVSIMHCSPSEVPADSSILRFALPIPFGAESLRKLAPAFDARTAALLVSSPVSADDFVIWGAGHFGRARVDRFYDLPVGTGFEPRWPEAFRIRADGPGTLAVGRGRSSIGLFSAGVFTAAIPSPFLSKAMGDYMMRMIRRDNETEKDHVYRWQSWNSIFEHLLFKVSRVAHGATIVLIDSGRLAELVGRFERSFDVTGDLRVSELLERGEKSSQIGIESISIEAAYNRQLAERLGTIARLAAVDGALVITEEFRVIAFGAKIRAPTWAGQVLVGPDGFNDNGQLFDISRHGTRHQSAVNLVGECDGSALAFVISSDGPIRGFARRQDGTAILCWPDFRTSMRLT